MKVYHFSVVITKDADGMYLAKVPSLRGCHTQAKNLPTLYKRIEEAVELCLEVEKSRKHAVPRETFVGIHQIAVSA